jgi:molybdopterin-containing oxidoreductase family iron-sulfur binding subunit
MNESIILRMLNDLERALLKPADKRKWVMLVDIRKCTGCHACSVACKSENKTPPGVDYRIVKEAEDGEFPNVMRIFMPGLCMQCDDAPCIKACTSGAIYKRPDGIVAIDYSKCLGCGGQATQACPYDALSVDNGNFYTDGTPEHMAYENGPVYEYGKKYMRTKDNSRGSCSKCHYCLHRLESGMLPTCVTTCLGGANYFGDINDKKSLVYQKAKELNLYVFMESEGTKPTTKYATDDVDLCKRCHE